MNTSAAKWELQYEACERHYRSILELISARTKLSKSSSVYKNLTEQISVSLENFLAEIKQLRTDLPTDLTSGERLRRLALIESMADKEKQIRVVFSQTTLASSKQAEEERQRKQLLFEGVGVADLGQSEDWATFPSTSRPQDPNWGQSEDIEAAASSREAILREQDRGLDDLYSVIVRQKRLAENIETEVEIQNELIDDIGDGIDRTNARLLETTTTVTRVHLRDKGVFKYWLIIALLFIIILIIIAIPSH